MSKDSNRPGVYCGYEYDQFLTSKVGDGPRGEYYHFALVKDNFIIAFGDEQGNYAGGVYASITFNQDRFIKEKEYIREDYPELYEKIKDFPLGWASFMREANPSDRFLYVAINPLEYEKIAAGEKDEYYYETLLWVARFLFLDVSKLDYLTKLKSKSKDSDEKFTELLKEALSDYSLEYRKYDTICFNRWDTGQTMTFEVRDIEFDKVCGSSVYSHGKGCFKIKLGAKL